MTNAFPTYQTRAYPRLLSTKRERSGIRLSPGAQIKNVVLKVGILTFSQTAVIFFSVLELEAILAMTDAIHVPERPRTQDGYTNDDHDSEDDEDDPSSRMRSSATSTNGQPNKNIRDRDKGNDSDSDFDFDL